MPLSLGNGVKLSSDPLSFLDPVGAVHLHPNGRARPDFQQCPQPLYVAFRPVADIQRASSIGMITVGSGVVRSPRRLRSLNRLWYARLCFATS